MYTVRIENSFAAAHFIREYNGKCENLHGHNYRVRVTASGEELGKGGMLVDFGLIKKALKEILDKLDHTHLNENTYFGSIEPSAENIAYFIYSRIIEKLSGTNISLVEVFETEKNVATYSPL